MSCKCKKYTVTVTECSHVGSSVLLPPIIEHYIFDCGGYKEHRDEMEREVELLLHLNGKDAEKITMKVLTGNVDDEQTLNKQVIQCFHNFIKSTERFSKIN